MNRLLCLCLVTAVLVGCSPKVEVANVPAKQNEVALTQQFQPVANSQNFPPFTLSDSEYPSWAVFAYACETGLLDGRQGFLGKLELDWKIDFVEQLMTYDACLSSYGTFKCDAVCITNTDIVRPSTVRPSTAILATSTSNGADALLSTTANSVKELTGKKIRGLPESVSDYFLYRLAQTEGLPKDSLLLEMMNPDEAAVAIQTGNEENVVVWEPFVMQTLRKNPKAKVLASSSVIKGEIIDMVVIGNDSLAKPGGEAFACCIIDTYYTVNEQLNNPATREQTLFGIGAKFSSLNATDMEAVTTRCQFYGTPSEGLQVFSEANVKQQMEKIMDYSLQRQQIQAPVPYGVKKEGVRLNFDSKYIETVAKSRTK